MVVSAVPLVSIVTPVYNGSEYLEQLIQSVRNQDYPNIEHIVIDDGSRDNGATVAILRKYPHLTWWSHTNRGQYATMNVGLQSAKGDIISFVNADDVISPNAVSAVVNFLAEHPGCDGVFGIATRIDAQGKPLPYYIPFRTAPIYFHQFFAHISHCSLYTKTAALRRHSLEFSPSLKYVGDYDWIVRVHREGLSIGVIRHELSKVRLHSEQASQQNATESRLELRNVIAAHNIRGPLYTILRTVYKFLFKAWLLGRIVRGDATMLPPQHWVRKYLRL
jgi:glycosyltransferase involved in cell wall biosynthesis